MLRNAVVNLVDFFYPLGNTPAVCLTQALPPEHDADILLLGCGDARNILFTTSSALIRPTTSLDITCCDIEPAILARNILLFTLIIDDVLQDKMDQIWDLYYHFYVHDRCIELLRAQSQKLQGLSESSDEWNRCEYGKLIRFCDEWTFNRVRNIWNLYDCEGEAQTVQKKKFETNLQFSNDVGKKITGAGAVLSGFRSAAPCGMEALEVLPELHKLFWEHGTTDLASGSLGRAQNTNPMFSSLTSDVSIIHYASDPLLGFHLATAFAPLAADASGPSDKATLDIKDQIVRTAKAEFQAWSVAFRKSAQSNLTLRFFAGDALAFCLALHGRAQGEPFPAKQYHGNWSFEPLVLDESAPSIHPPPSSFDVIDTSNLVDHLGALNVLVAAAPLLKATRSSVLYTEMLVARQQDLQAAVDSLLCGPFATIACLLGLVNPEYCTNASAAAGLDEAAFNAITQATGSATAHGQLRCRMSWKLSLLENSEKSLAAGRSLMQADEKDLARLLYELYLKMFEHENLTQVFSNLTANMLTATANPNYHRASLVALMWHVKHHVIADWSTLMSCFLDLIESDRTLLTGRNYIQELYLYLHIFELHTVPTLDKGFEQFSSSRNARDLSMWQSLPSHLSITLVVPRVQIDVLTDMSRLEIGSPALSCSLQASAARPHGDWENRFCVLQLCFGRVRSHGSRASDNFKVSVEEDPKGWGSRSPLVVSFLVPTWVVLLEREKASISIGLQSTPHSAARFTKLLGLRQNIFETTLGCDQHVFITKGRPNQPESTTAVSVAQLRESDTNKKADYQTGIQPNLTGSPKKISSLTCRVELLSHRYRSVLRDGAAVTVEQSSPLKVTVKIGDEGLQCHIRIPLPVEGKRSKLRIARKSSYVEIDAPVLTEPHLFPDFIFPLSLEQQAESPGPFLPVNWNMPSLKLAGLPVLDLKKSNELQWLIPHISHIFSTREARTRDANMATVPSSGHVQDLRVDFKEGLLSLFMHFSGLQGQKARSFGLHKPEKGGVHVLIFVAALQLELANQTVILEAAVLPLTNKMMHDPLVMNFFRSITNHEQICNITVTDAELLLWKKILPSFTERCRTWNHIPKTCEYQKLAQVPLEAGLQDGQTPLCSCGQGRIPLELYRGWNVPHLEPMLKKYATRAAISPCFPVPYVEDCFQKYSQATTQMKDIDDAATRATTRAAVPGSVDRTCKVCGQGESSDALDKSPTSLLCARCRSVRYCSKACQKKDWKDHKSKCCAA